MANSGYDIIFVGGGLSAAATVCGLCENLENVRRNKKLNILVLDKDGNFWTGVPYGNNSEPDYLLIHNLEKTQHPPFAKWMRDNIFSLCNGVDTTSPFLRNWHNVYKEKIDSLNLEEIFFPRQWFGLFIREYMSALMEKHRDSMDISLKTEEAVDIIPREMDFDVAVSGGKHFLASNVVLAIGSIPKDSRQFSQSATSRPEYITDANACADFDLQRNFALPMDARSSKARILIMGSSASAIETVYFAFSRVNVRKKIEEIVIISTSGILVGGIRSFNSDYKNLSPHAIARSSSDIYIKATLEMARMNSLRIIKGKVETLSYENGKFLLTYCNGGSNETLVGDFVINCSGRGNLLSTSSTLLGNLSGRFPVEDQCRGFIVDSDNEVIGYPGFYTIGPVLNRGIAKQVESIAAVFTEGQITGSVLAKKCVMPKNVTISEMC